MKKTILAISIVASLAFAGSSFASTAPEKKLVFGTVLLVVSCVNSNSNVIEFKSLDGHVTCVKVLKELKKASSKVDSIGS